MDNLISVIIPVYNVEQYLQECLFSIRNQTYKNLEIILVNDGSTDNSKNICEEACAKDSRFKLINQDNKGLSAARNTGLAHANGDIIAFVDSDDCVHERYIEYMYKAMKETNTDMTICEYIKGTELKQYLNNTKQIQYSHKVVDRKALVLDLATLGIGNRAEPVVVAWNKLIKKELLADISFKIGKLHEDEFMINSYLERIESVAWINAPLYFYRQRKSSIMANMDIRHLELLEADRERIAVIEKFFNQDIVWLFIRKAILNGCFFIENNCNKENEYIVKRRVIKHFLTVYIQYFKYIPLNKKKDCIKTMALYLMKYPV